MNRRTLCTLGLTVLSMLGPVAAARSQAAPAAGVEVRLAGAAAAPHALEVKIDNFSFIPATVTVDVGTTVTWVNRDDIPHTVVSPDKVFKSKTLDTDDKFSFVFTKAGRYPYFCSIHPKMTGEVVVR
ncbi:MAG TPA: cupredoxin domain-containing protein [Thermoanaerobaculia bacterium]|nr:cupredoxin domain-containing protein [Thermoanaerobaculia bacterium]